MPRVSMEGFKATRCAKRSCKTGSFVLHRHHKANEKFFLDVLHGKYRSQRWYQQMVSDYYQFRPKDVILICEAHHAEVHHAYNKLIGKYVRSNGPPQHWTKQQAENLMSLLRQACKIWLVKSTPGMKGGFKELVKVRAAEKPKPR